MPPGRSPPSSSTTTPPGHLATCLASLAANGVGAVVVVDNGSVDGPDQVVRAAGVRWLPTGANLGYGRAANRGAATRRGPRRAATCWSATPISSWAPGPWTTLVSSLAADPEPRASSGPACWNDDGSLYPSARTFPDMVDAIGHGLFGMVAPGNRFTRRYRLLDWDHRQSGPGGLGLRRLLPRPPGGVGRGRWLRPVVFHVHGGRRPVLAARPGRLGRRLRAGGRGRHVQGVSTNQPPLPDAGGPPPFHVAVRLAHHDRGPGGPPCRWWRSGWPPAWRWRPSTTAWPVRRPGGCRAGASRRDAARPIRGTGPASNPVGPTGSGSTWPEVVARPDRYPERRYGQSFVEQKGGARRRNRRRPHPPGPDPVDVLQRHRGGGRARDPGHMGQPGSPPERRSTAPGGTAADRRHGLERGLRGRRVRQVRSRPSPTPRTPRASPPATATASSTFTRPPRPRPARTPPSASSPTRWA